MNVVFIGVLCLAASAVLVWVWNVRQKADATMRKLLELEQAHAEKVRAIGRAPEHRELFEERDARTMGMPVELDPTRRCSTCKHFDLEEGQALAARHGPFMLAALHVSPAEMGIVHTPEGEEVARDIPAAAKWADFGYCEPRNEGIWGRTDADRRSRMQSDDGVEGAFLPLDRLQQQLDCYEPRS